MTINMKVPKYMVTSAYMKNNFAFQIVLKSSILINLEELLLYSVN